MSTGSLSFRELAYDAAVMTAKHVAAEYGKEMTEFALGTTDKFSEDYGLDGLRIYTQTGLIAKQFFENNNERKICLQEINPFDHYLVYPLTDFATDYVAIPALKITYMIVGFSLASLVGCVNTEYGRRLSDALDDPVSTQTLLSLINRIQSVSIQWGQREPSNIFLIAYPETCSILAARSISTFTRDASKTLRIPQHLRKVIDSVGTAAIEELVRPLSEVGIDLGRRLVSGSSSQAQTIETASVSVSDEAKCVPQTENKGSYLSKFSWAAASLTYTAGKYAVSSVATGATNVTVSLIRGSTAKAASSEMPTVSDSNGVEVVTQLETTQSISYWSGIKNGVGYCASGVGYFASGVGSLVKPLVPEKVKTVAGFAVAGAAWAGGKIAEVAVRLLCNKCKNDVSKTEKIVRQQIVKIAAQSICRQAVSSSIRGMVVYGLYKATEQAIFTLMAHDGERSQELCRTVAQTTSLCMTVAGTVLWIRCLAPTAERLYHSYTPNHNPNASLFSDMAALMDQSYVSTLISHISKKLEEKGCESTRLENFAKRVVEITIKNPFEDDETKTN